MRDAFRSFIDLIMSILARLADWLYSPPSIGVKLTISQGNELSAVSRFVANFSLA